MSEVALVPQLRFPEFSREWEVKNFGDFIVSRNEYSDVEIPLYSLTIKEGVVPKSKRYEREFLVGDKSSAYKVVSPYDFVYNPMNLRFGAIAMYKQKQKVFVSKYYDVFQMKNANTLFFENYFKTNKMIGFYNKMSTGTLEEKKRVHFSDFIKFKKPIPLLPEQQKIAAFLTAVDNKIEQLSKKKELLGEYKKGVMQQIFSQAIRFKADDGSDFPDWEKKSLGGVINTIKNGTSINQNSNSSGYQVTRIETISTGKINLNKVGYVDTDEDLSGHKLQYGDILFSNINSPAHIGKVAYVGREIDLYHGMNLLLIRANHTILNPEFLYLFLIRKNTRQFFQKICNKAVNQASINQTDLKKTPIIFPGLEEQAKITNFLSSIDSRIEQVGKQLDESKQFKKALLQQMFV